MSTQDGKDFFQSKQTWGAILFLLGPSLKSVGIDLDEAQVQAVVEFIVQGIGGALFAWGAVSKSRKPTTTVLGAKIPGV